MADILDPWMDVANRHKIRFYSSEHGGVTGLMPEQFSQSFSNTYTAPFADVLSSFNTGIIAAQEFLAEGGKVDFSAVFKELTNRVWKGGSPLSTDLRLKYISRRSAWEDVMRPVQRLIEMSASRVAWKIEKELEVGGKGKRRLAGTLLKPPPPLLVEFGYVLRLRRALIDSLTVEWSNISDENGVPVMAEVQLRISTKRAFVSGDEDVEMAMEGFETVGVT